MRGTRKGPPKKNLRAVCWNEMLLRFSGYKLMRADTKGLKRRLEVNPNLHGPAAGGATRIFSSLSPRKSVHADQTKSRNRRAQGFKV